MKIVSKIFAVSLMALMLSAAAVAAEQVKSSAGDEVSPNGGSDSCGLGWQVTKSKTLMGTFTRATTNAYLSPTWSMTSGTSGCEKHDFAKKDSETVKYVASNFYSIKADMAEGQGEYLTGLARLLGCDDTAVLGFGTATQKSFKSITTGADAYQTLQNVRSVISKDPSLSRGCGITG
jgi:hypothetical protein